MLIEKIKNMNIYWAVYLLILVSGCVMDTRNGDPKEIAKGKEMTVRYILDSCDSYRREYSVLDRFIDSLINDRIDYLKRDAMEMKNRKRSDVIFDPWITCECEIENTDVVLIMDLKFILSDVYIDDYAENYKIYYYMDRGDVRCVEY